MELRSSDHPLALVALSVEASSFWELNRSSEELTFPFSDHFLINQYNQSSRSTKDLKRILELKDLRSSCALNN